MEARVVLFFIVLLGVMMASGITAQGDYEALHHNTYKEIQRLKVKGVAQRLRTHGSELWLTTKKILYVYSHTLNLLRSIPLQGIRRASSVVATERDQLMVADNRGGLQILHTNGSHIETLQTGDFRDVVIHQHQVYALRDKWMSSRVYVYKQNEIGVWIRMNRVTMETKGWRLAVYNNTLYATYRYHSHLYHYSMSGELLIQSGEYGEDNKGVEPGMLYQPRICSIDRRGNVLVADQSNQRLQVYNNTGHWNVVSLGENAQWTLDAVVSRTLDTLWVAEKSTVDYRYYIVKYTKQ